MVGTEKDVRSRTYREGGPVVDREVLVYSGEERGDTGWGVVRIES